VTEPFGSGLKKGRCVVRGRSRWFLGMLMSLVVAAGAPGQQEPRSCQDKLYHEGDCEMTCQYRYVRDYFGSYWCTVTPVSAKGCLRVEFANPYRTYVCGLVDSFDKQLCAQGYAYESEALCAAGSGGEGLEVYIKKCESTSY